MLLWRAKDKRANLDDPQQSEHAFDAAMIPVYPPAEGDLDLGLHARDVQAIRAARRFKVVPKRDSSA